MEKTLETYLPILARAFLAQIFLLSAFGKITDYGGTVEYMAGAGVPVPAVLLAGAILFLLAGGVSVLVGFQARIGAVLLIVFLVLATYFFHNFWAFEPDAEEFFQEMIQFQKNLGLLGGLLLIVARGPGSLSVDERRAAS